MIRKAKAVWRGTGRAGSGNNNDRAEYGAGGAQRDGPW